MLWSFFGIFSCCTRSTAKDADDLLLSRPDRLPNCIFCDVSKEKGFDVVWQVRPSPLNNRVHYLNPPCIDRTIISLCSMTIDLLLLTICSSYPGSISVSQMRCLFSKAQVHHVLRVESVKALTKADAELGVCYPCGADVNGRDIRYSEGDGDDWQSDVR